jgi:hypothetical protein
MLKLLKPLRSFKEHNDVTRIQTTLFEIVTRDAANNPEIYKETDIKAEMETLHLLLGRINEINLSDLQD